VTLRNGKLLDPDHDEVVIRSRSGKTTTTTIRGGGGGGEESPMEMWSDDEGGGEGEDWLSYCSERGDLLEFEGMTGSHSGGESDTESIVDALASLVSRQH